MKILYIHHDTRFARNVSELVYFINGLGKYCDLVVYGKRNIRFDHTAKKVEYNKKNDDVINVIKREKPDILLVGKTKRIESIEESLGDIVPTVIIEQEFIGRNNSKNGLVARMSKKHNISALIVRGYHPEALNIVDCPVYWLPFAANEQEFYTELVDHSDRIPKIFFMGHAAGDMKRRKNRFYRVRTKALFKLKEAGLLPPPYRKRYTSTRRKVYLYHIRKYYGGLSCAFGPLKQIPLKSFEIMATGTALLTQEIRPEIKEQLFGNEQHYFVYKDDCSDVVDVADELLTNHSLRKEVCSRALHTINMRHLHKHRVLELWQMLDSVVRGKEYKSQTFKFIGR